MFAACSFRLDKRFSAHRVPREAHAAYREHLMAEVERARLLQKYMKEVGQPRDRRAALYFQWIRPIEDTLRRMGETPN